MYQNFSWNKWMKIGAITAQKIMKIINNLYELGNFVVSQSQTLHSYRNYPSYPWEQTTPYDELWLIAENNSPFINWPWREQRNIVYIYTLPFTFTCFHSLKDGRSHYFNSWLITIQYQCYSNTAQILAQLLQYTLQTYTTSQQNSPQKLFIFTGNAKYTHVTSIHMTTPQCKNDCHQW